MSKKISFPIMLALGMLACGRDAQAQSRQYGEYAVYYIDQGENLALNAYESNRPIYQGQTENPFYYDAYYYAYYAKYYAGQASYSDSAQAWYEAMVYAYTAYYYEPSNASYAKSSLYEGYIYAYYAWYYASRGR
jgi:hypothetical protein